MCSRFEVPLLSSIYIERFGVEPQPGFFEALRAGNKPGNAGVVFPSFTGALIRRPREYGSGDDAVPPREVVQGVFGLLPHWAKDQKLALRTYNSRSETADKLPSFRGAWEKSRHCIIPVMSFIEPDWRSGKCVWTPIGRKDGQPAGLAGLWDTWHPTGLPAVHSFTMLTIPAETHALMRNYHRPEKDKRMIVVLRDEDYDAWLDAPPEQSRKYLAPYPASLLEPYPKTSGMSQATAAKQSMQPVTRQQQKTLI